MNHRREDTSGANTFNQVQTRICISKPFYVVTERALRCTFDNSVSRKCSEIPSGRAVSSFSNRVTVERCVFLFFLLPLFFPTLLFSSKKKKKGDPLPAYHCQTEQFTEKREPRNKKQFATVRTRFARRDTIFLYFVFFWLASPYVQLAYAETIENAFTSSTRNPSVEVSARRQIVL